MDPSNLPSAWLVFQVRNAWLGVDPHLVIEVSDFGVPSRLPRAPQHILGLLEHRGGVVAVLDLGEFLSLSQREDEADDLRTGRCVVVATDEMTAGIVSDRVVGIVDAKELGIGQPTLAGERLTDFALGQCEHEGRVVLLIDPAKLFEAARVRN